MAPDKRSQFGAHYTNQYMIMRIVQPVGTTLGTVENVPLPGSRMRRTGTPPAPPPRRRLHGATGHPSPFEYPQFSGYKLVLTLGP